MRRGEVWLINLDPSIGPEIRKTRPSVIVPIADWKEHYTVAPWMVHLLPDSQNGLRKPSAADAF